MKIYVNRALKKHPWGGGAHFVTNLVEGLMTRGHQVVFDFQKDIDVIFMIDPRHEEGGSSVNEIFQYKLKNKNTKVVHRINECDARKNSSGMDELLLNSNKIADVTIFISNWLKDYFVSRGFQKESHVIYNGCNLTHFFPRLNADLTSAPIKIVTHHWSDNWLKGFDVYKKLDFLCKKHPEKYQFTYIGRYCKEYSPVSTKLISPLYGKDLGDELRKHDIYITASRWEPCGMHHIEGAASGLPVLYHKDGGGIPEGCKIHGIEFVFDNLEEKLIEIIEKRISLIKKIDKSVLSSDSCINSYIEIIEKLK
jgi:hypothetical protein